MISVTWFTDDCPVGEAILPDRGSCNCLYNSLKDKYPELFFNAFENGSPLVLGTWRSLDTADGTMTATEVARCCNLWLAEHGHRSPTQEEWGLIKEKVFNEA